jgi:hypothetical protein
VRRSVLLGMRNVSDNCCGENQNPHFMFKNFFSKNCAVYQIMRKSFVEQDRPQTTIWNICIACWITKATNTHSEYVTLIAFLQQQWSQECASLLRYMYIACLVTNHNTTRESSPIQQQFQVFITEMYSVHCAVRTWF